MRASRGSGSTTRRGFLEGGALALFSALCNRAYPVLPGSRDGAGARLKIGIVSDIHISVLGDSKSGEFDRPPNAKTFIQALDRFRAANVDAVLIPGDLTNHGYISQLMAVGDAWRKVFPDDRAADGRPVTKLFIGGNHDWEGWKYGHDGQKTFPDVAELKRNIICEHPDEMWKAAFGEPFGKVVDKVVNGYRFIGVHWPFHTADAAKYLKTVRNTLPGDRPFFYFQHPPLPGTVPGSGARASAADILKSFPNAVAVTGHTHSSVTDERSIWQGGFTAIDAGTLRSICPPDGRENSGPMRNSGFKQMPSIRTADCRHGLMMTVYDDRIVVSRHDHVSDAPLGPDWIIPIDGTRPFNLRRRAAAAPAPCFPAGAKPVLSEPFEGKTRDGRKRCQIALRFPQAMPSDSTRGRAMDYRVEVKITQGGLVDETYMVRRFMAEGFCKPESCVPKDMECVLDADAIPHECRLKIEVRAADCYGNMSEPISTGTIKLKGVVVRW